MKSFKHPITTLTILILVLLMFGTTIKSEAQVVTHPLSGISTTATFHSYVHRINDTTGIEIKYFIVESPTNGIKTAFDACDVCWAQYKGYVQLGNFMRCVNCGNTYPSDDLGAQGTGGCWPSYLPHTTDGTDLIIEVADLIPGAFMFEEVPMDPPASTGIVQSSNLPVYFEVNNQPGLISLNMPSVKTERIVRVISLNGQVSFSERTFTSELIINTGDGSYVSRA